jgi:hypothetical protein
MEGGKGRENCVIIVRWHIAHGAYLCHFTSAHDTFCLGGIATDKGLDVLNPFSC